MGTELTPYNLTPSEWQKLASMVNHAMLWTNTSEGAVWSGLSAFSHKQSRCLDLLDPGTMAEGIVFREKDVTTAGVRDWALLKKIQIMLGRTDGRVLICRYAYDAACRKLDIHARNVQEWIPEAKLTDQTTKQTKKEIRASAYYSPDRRHDESNSRGADVGGRSGTCAPSRWIPDARQGRSRHGEAYGTAAPARERR